MKSRLRGWTKPKDYKAQVPRLLWRGPEVLGCSVELVNPLSIAIIPAPIPSPITSNNWPPQQVPQASKWGTSRTDPAVMLCSPPKQSGTSQRAARSPQRLGAVGCYLRLWGSIQSFSTILWKILWHSLRWCVCAGLYL